MRILLAPPLIVKINNPPSVSPNPVFCFYCPVCGRQVKVQLVRSDYFRNKKLDEELAFDVHNKKQHHKVKEM